MVKYDPEKHRRRSIRLKEYDYSQDGAYFITICTHHRDCLLGEVVDGQMQLNTTGLCIQACLQKLPQNFPTLSMDAWVIMPNHIHAIFWLQSSRRGDAFGNCPSHLALTPIPNASPSSTIARSPQDSPPCHPRGTQPSSIAAIVQNFKSVSTRRINQLQNSPGQIIWQRNYYEHIIRDSTALQFIQDYIRNNPATWENDQLHPGYQVIG